MWGAAPDCRGCSRGRGGSGHTAAEAQQPQKKCPEFLVYPHFKLNLKTTIFFLTCCKTFSVNISWSLEISTTFPSICLHKKNRLHIITLQLFRLSPAFIYKIYAATQFTPLFWGSCPPFGAMTVIHSLGAGLLARSKSQERKVSRLHLQICHLIYIKCSRRLRILTCILENNKCW